MAVLLFALALSSFTGCGKKEEEISESSSSEAEIIESSTESSSSVPESSESSVEESSSEESSEAEEPEGAVSPYTGLRVEEEISNQRPIAIMLNNAPISTPQWGISEADIIVEALVEGGMTRMMGVFQNIPDDTVIGSVRSLRHSYIDFVAWFDAIIAHAGGSNLAMDALWRRTNIDNINALVYDGSYFYRDSWRLRMQAYEHSMVTTGELLHTYLSGADCRRDLQAGYNPELVFAEDASVVSGRKMEEVTVAFGSGKNTYFTYNTETGCYEGREYNEPYVDGLTEEVVPFRNLIVIQTDVWVCDQAGHQDMDLIGEGTGYICLGGQTAEITWTRRHEDAPFVFAYEDGSEVTLGTGKTYIAVIAQSGSVS